MPVAELFLGAFLQVLFDRLAPGGGDLLNFARREKIHSLFTRWRKTLHEIRSVLDDAEEKQLEDGDVDSWLEDLTDLAYDLDDLVDEFATEVLRHKFKAEPPQAGPSKVLAILPTCCTKLSPRTLWYDHTMRSKIEGVDRRFQDIIERKSRLGLLQKVAARPASARARQRPETTSLIHEPRIHGRDEEKEEIIRDFLLIMDESSSSSGGHKIGVLPIVGMGGLGKTTLAQMIYDDEEVNGHFDLKAWVCVSDDEFDVTRITKALLESVTKRPCELKELDQIQVQLKENLAGKKFFIVLDDVWSKNYKQWNVLKSPFDDGAPGSKVIVTTRDNEVALMMRTVQSRVLQHLTDDDCWLVFSQHAFANTSIDENPNLESIGRQIAKKCKGLPLAASTLGGLLRCNETENEWEGVLNSKVWAHDRGDNILPALSVSYHYLPSHLKRCFAYCAIIPKDYEFEEEELVRLWMAEGFIQQPKAEKEILEDVGVKYFRELLSRSFFQQASGVEASKFVMHDLINDLAQLVARDTCFRLEDKLKDHNLYDDSLKKARHSSYIRDLRNGRLKFEIFYKSEQMRTFYPFSLEKSNYYDRCYLTSDVPLNLLPRMRRLRVLSLSRYRIYEVPRSVGGMKHIRYLDLSFTYIERLPESLGSLYNLQTLMLRGCRCLKKLPTEMGNLINLRHLDITDSTTSLEEMPLGIGKLKSLRTLSDFLITKGNGIRIKELGNLNDLRGTIRLRGLENVVDPLHAMAANMNAKQSLTGLSMAWRESLDDDSSNERVIVEERVLDMLRPHKNLKELHIEGYHGTRFPTWIEDRQFSCMARISLQNCNNCTSLPPLGQLPTLKVLYIKGMVAVEHVGLEFYGQGSSKPFPLLETLTFEDMPEWVDWYSFGDDNNEVQPFSHVSELSILYCPKLLGVLPGGLVCLKKMEIEECPLFRVHEVPSLVLPSLTTLSVRDVSIPSLPMLLEMSTTALECTSLSSVEIRDVSIPESLWCSPSVAGEEEEEEDNTSATSTLAKHLGSITSLMIQNVRKLASLQKWITQGLMKLEELEIRRCEELTTLWEKNELAGFGHEHLPGLRRLKIGGCPQLVSLFEEEGQQKQCTGLPSVEYLTIIFCEKLEILPRGMHSTFTSLGDLSIWGCPKLVSFPEGGSPSALRKLEVRYCEALQSLSGWVTESSFLEEVMVVGCGSLKYLTPSRGAAGGGLPSTLKRLEIQNCEKLEGLIEEEEEEEEEEAEQGMTKINWPPFLESISIDACKSLKYLPDALPILPNSRYSITTNDLRRNNLSELRIEGCGKLVSIPEGWFPRLLNSLKTLGLPAALAATSSFLLLLRRGNFIDCLTSLSIRDINYYDVGKSNPLLEWGPHRFSSLKRLQLWGAALQEEEEASSSTTTRSVSGSSGSSRVDGGILLPNSLTSLDIFCFPNLENLSSLIRDLQNHPSLETLSLLNCPRLATLPEQGLPPSLLYLQIWHCPVLEQLVEKGKGKYWPLIAHIPRVEIDGRDM